MNASSTTQCLFCKFARSSRQIPAACRNFSSSPGRFARKPKFPSVKAPKAKLTNVPNLEPEYLEKNFTSKQRAAIQAASKLVNNDNVKQVEKNRHPWSPNYVDDMTQIDPAMDHAVKAPWQNIDEASRLKDDDEWDSELYELARNLPDDEDQAIEAWRKYDQNMRVTVGKEEAELRPRTAVAPDLTRLGESNPAAKPAVAKAEDGNRKQEAAPTPDLLRLMQETGLSARQIQALTVKTIVTHNVTNQTRLGKIAKMYCLTVAGNGNGLVGIGEGKGIEAGEAIEQSRLRAIRNMRPILRYEDRTIFGQVNGKVSATELELYARPPGFGLRCQNYIFQICRAAGISDLAARVTRSRNPMNTAKATIQALMSQKDPEDIARARGKKLVDVRKVYYAGQV